MNPPIMQNTSPQAVESLDSLLTLWATFTSDNCQQFVVLSHFPCIIVNISAQTKFVLTPRDTALTSYWVIAEPTVFDIFLHVL